MRLRSLLPTRADLAAAVALDGPIVQPLNLASPWAPAHSLAHVAAPSWLTGQLSRTEAMAVPAVARARHITCGTVARIPLRAYRRGADAPLDDAAAPSWLTATNAQLPPYHRMLWTMDDLFFYGLSCWSRTNGSDGRPRQLDRIPMGRWSVDAQGRVSVDDQLQRTDQVVVLYGPHEGLLQYAGEAIRHAADLQRAATVAARNPAAYLVLRQTGGQPLPQRSDDPAVLTVERLLETWTAARRGDNGGVGYINSSLEVQQLGTFDAHLLIEGRNAAAVDVARAASLPADLLDASGTAPSLTYANSRDNDRRAVDYGVGLYLSAISARLSQDDVVPLGTRVAFDLEDWLAHTVPGQQPGTQPTDAPETPQ